VVEEPLLADDGYPSEAELEKIKNWPPPEKDLFELDALMQYVHERWKYPTFWEEDQVEEFGRPHRRYTFSTGGWSGNESLVTAMEENPVLSMIAPWSWQRGGHYEYRLPLPR
jgi:hypothetical protein